MLSTSFEGLANTGSLSRTLPRTRDKFKSTEYLREQARLKRTNAELERAQQWTAASAERPIRIGHDVRGADARIMLESRDVVSHGTPSRVKPASAKKAPPPKALKLVIRDICAQDLPNADAVGGSDPFARFTLLECEDKRISSCTKALQNSLNPAWSDVIELIIPAGSLPSRSKEPLIHLAVLDEDVAEAGEDGDVDLLGETVLRLTETSGAYFRVPMEGVGIYDGKKQPWFSLVSFTYEISEYIPPPSAALLLGGIELHDAPLAQLAALGVLSGLRVRFGVPEASAVASKPLISTPPVPPTTCSFLAWDDLTVVLELGNAKRPPLLRAELCSDAWDDGATALAAGDVRLEPGSVTGGAPNAAVVSLAGASFRCRLQLFFDIVEPDVSV
jgi:hypothetical protein